MRTDLKHSYAGYLKSFASRVEEAGKDEDMAASSMMTGTAPMMAFAAQKTGVQRRRRISPEAGRGLEILGHAIEYLADEYIYEGGKFNLADPRVQAVLLLMERNREIYFSCPEVPGLGERLRAWLGLRTA